MSKVRQATTRQSQGKYSKANSSLGKPSDSRFSPRKTIARSKITTDPDTFQGRDNAFSSETVQKIVREGYDVNEEPITVWHDPKLNKYVVISGHSRWEASKKLHQSGKQNLDPFPVREFIGTKEQARFYAVVESNRSGTQEGIGSDIKAYKEMKAADASREAMLSIFKKDSYINRLRDYAYLDPKGRFIEALISEQRGSFPLIESKAGWIGQLRRAYPSITDSHEREMWAFLYENTKGASMRKDDFFRAVERKVNNIGFDPATRLNLSNQKSESLYIDNKKSQIDDIDGRINDHLSNIGKLQQRIATIVHNGGSEESTSIRRLKKEICDRQDRIREAYAERVKVEDTAQQADKSQSSDLFSSLSGLGFTLSGISLPCCDDVDKPAPTKSNEDTSDTTQKGKPKPVEDETTSFITNKPLQIPDKAPETGNFDEFTREMRDAYVENGMENLTRVKVEKIARERYSITNKLEVKELTELGIIQGARDTIEKADTPDEAYQSLLSKYRKQINLSLRTSTSTILQQYSTSPHLGYAMGLFCGLHRLKEEEYYFEPSAGNGMLALAGTPSQGVMNEIDPLRNRNLQQQGFKGVTNFNGAQEAEGMKKALQKQNLPQRYQAMLTNPPFGSLDEKVRWRGFPIGALEHYMAIQALELMKDDGRAAIIVGGHTRYKDRYGDKTVTGRDKYFLGYLYRYYNVVDVIPLTKAFDKMGTGFDTRVILIDGRIVSPTDGGRIVPFFDPERDTPVQDPMEVWKRISAHTHQSKGKSADDIPPLESLSEAQKKYSVRFDDTVEAQYTDMRDFEKFKATDFPEKERPITITVKAYGTRLYSHFQYLALPFKERFVTEQGFFSQKEVVKTTKSRAKIDQKALHAHIVFKLDGTYRKRIKRTLKEFEQSQANKEEPAPQFPESDIPFTPGDIIKEYNVPSFGASPMGFIIYRVIEGPTENEYRIELQEQTGEPMYDFDESELPMEIDYHIPGAHGEILERGGTPDNDDDDELELMRLEADAKIKIALALNNE